MSLKIIWKYAALLIPQINLGTSIIEKVMILIWVTIYSYIQLFLYQKAHNWIKTSLLFIHFFFFLKQMYIFYNKNILFINKASIYRLYFESCYYFFKTDVGYVCSIFFSNTEKFKDLMTSLCVSNLFTIKNFNAQIK